MSNLVSTKYTNDQDAHLSSRYLRIQYGGTKLGSKDDSIVIAGKDYSALQWFLNSNPHGQIRMTMFSGRAPISTVVAVQAFKIQLENPYAYIDNRWSIIQLPGIPAIRIQYQHDTHGASIEPQTA